MDQQKAWQADREEGDEFFYRDDLYLRLTTEAFDLVAELWPKPGSATVHLDASQWVRLRKFLLTVPELGDLP